MGLGHDKGTRTAGEVFPHLSREASYCAEGGRKSQPVTGPDKLARSGIMTVPACPSLPISAGSRLGADEDQSEGHQHTRHAALRTRAISPIATSTGASALDQTKFAPWRGSAYHRVASTIPTLGSEARTGLDRGSAPSSHSTPAARKQPMASHPTRRRFSAKSSGGSMAVSPQRPSTGPHPARKPTGSGHTAREPNRAPTADARPDRPL